MPLENTPLSVKERAILVTRLQETQPGAGTKELDYLMKWAETVRATGAILDEVESGELLIAVVKDTIFLTRKGTGTAYVAIRNGRVLFHGDLKKEA